MLGAPAITLGAPSNTLELDIRVCSFPPMQVENYSYQVLPAYISLDNTQLGLAQN